MKILITGGAGYIGSMLTGRLLKEGHQVIVYDNLMYNQTSLFNYCSNPDFHFIKADVEDYGRLQKAVSKAEVVIPLAAIVGAPACKKNPVRTEVVNFHCLLSIINCREEKKIIFPSTDSIYGNAGEELCTEETKPNPMSWYAKLKVDAEKELLKKGNCVILRQATVFGVSQRMRTDLMLNDFVKEAMYRGYIVLYESGIKRNFMHILDLCEAYVHVLENYDSMAGGIYNVGNDECNLTKLELAIKVKEQNPGFEIIVKDEIDSDPDQRNYFVSNEKLTETGFEADMSIDEGIRELNMFYKMFPRSLYKNA